MRICDTQPFDGKILEKEYSFEGNVMFCFRPGEQNIWYTEVFFPVVTQVYSQKENQSSSSMGVKTTTELVGDS